MKFWQWTLTAVVGGLSTIHIYLTPLALVALIPVYEYVNTTQDTVFRRFRHGWWYGYVFMSTVIYWTLNSYPLNWTGIDDPVLGVFFVLLVWSVVSCVLGLLMSGFFVFAPVVLRGTRYGFLLLPMLWVLCEWVRMWGFTLVTWGPGSVWLAYFSYGMLGFTLSNYDGLLYIARWGGVYALSLVTASINLYLWILYTRRLRMVSRRVLIGIGIMLGSAFLLLLSYPYHPPQTQLHIETISTDFEATLSTPYYRSQAETDTLMTALTELAHSGRHSDIIVFPEATDILDTFTRNHISIQHTLHALFPDHEVLLMLAERVDHVDGARETIVMISSTRGEIARRDKYLLIAFGEYMPYALSYPLRHLGLAHAVHGVEANRTYLPGPLPTPVYFHGNNIIALACSEMLSPELYWRTARGVDHPLLINLSSQSDFHHGMNPYLQMRAMARVHAAWSNAPYYQSTNGAPMVRVE